MKKKKRPQSEEKSPFLIDEQNLDLEWKRLPRQYKRFADLLANAKLKANTAKSNMELVEAEISMKVRRNPKAYFLDKVSEMAIEMVVKQSDSYQIAVREYHDALHAVDTLKASVEGMDKVADSLDGLTKLFLNAYYAGRKPPKTDEQTDQRLKRETRKGLG